MLCVLAGSLVKLVYFTKNDDRSDDGEEGTSPKMALEKSKGSSSYPVVKGRLNFKKFETSKINDCLEFIKSMNLYLGGMYRIVFICFATPNDLYLNVSNLRDASNHAQR